MSLGIGLFLVGVICFIFGLFRVRRAKDIRANKGSVAVGRDNVGSITVTTQQNPQNEGASSFWAIWNAVTGFATLLGLAITLWPVK